MAEALGDELEHWSVRIFATDLDKEAIAFARRGHYPATALAAVPAALRRRYFIEEAGAYTVNKAVRRLLLFGEHDLGERPAFPQIDLCLCRNVLIYFTSELQRRTLEVFAFALREDGYLALGKAETTSPLPGYFTPVNQATRVYRRTGERLLLPPSERSAPMRTRAPHGTPPAGQELARARREVQTAVAAQLAAEEVLLLLPVGVAVVDQHYDLQRLNNVARRLLGIHSPALGQDLVHLAQTVPSRELRAAIDAALRGEVRTLGELASTTAIPSETRYLQITCQPHPAAAPGLVVLTIIDVTAVVAERAVRTQEQAETARLRIQVGQLDAANLELLAANEAMATSEALLRQANEAYVLGSEEIQAATEEVETLNEELQATNEELETLNEEQQATVEELETTNDELRARGQEVQEVAASLEEQRGRLAAILESMGDAVVVLDHEERAVFTNALFDQLVGAKGGEFAAADAEGRLLPPEATPQRRVHSGEHLGMEFTLVGADGQRRWYEATGRPIRADLPSEEVVLVLRDITDRALPRLQDAFLALASHELRTPLTVMRAHLDLLGRGLIRGTDPARLQEQVAQARRQTTRLTDLVNDLLDVARLSGGALHLRRTPLDLTQLLARVVETVRVLAPERMVRLDVPAVPVVIDGDADRLEQVVLNLLTNALTYASGSPIDVCLRQADREATIDVVDQGPGIPAAALPHLFTRFYQVAVSGEGNRGGMGLGLYIAREIVEAHGGTITVHSLVGEGSTFTVRLPLAGEAVAAEPTS